MDKINRRTDLLKQYVNCASPQWKNTPSLTLWIDIFAPSSYNIALCEVASNSNRK